MGKTAGSIVGRVSEKGKFPVEASKLDVGGKGCQHQEPCASCHSQPHTRRRCILGDVVPRVGRVCAVARPPQRQASRLSSHLWQQTTCLAPSAQVRQWPLGPVSSAHSGHQEGVTSPASAAKKLSEECKAPVSLLDDSTLSKLSPQTRALAPLPQPAPAHTAVEPGGTTQAILPIPISLLSNPNPFLGVSAFACQKAAGWVPGMLHP